MTIRVLCGELRLPMDKVFAVANRERLRNVSVYQDVDYICGKVRRPTVTFPNVVGLYNRKGFNERLLPGAV